MSMTEYYAKSAADSIAKLAEAVTQLEVENTELKKPWGAFGEFEKIELASKRIDITTEHGWQQYQSMYVADHARAVRNAEVSAANNALLKRLVDTIQALGFRSEWTDFRGRGKAKTVKADWFAALSGCMNRDPFSLTRLEDLNRNMVAARQKHVADAERTETQRKYAEEREANERKLLVRSVEVANALGIDPTEADADSLKDEIRKRDKYIDLAVAGMDTRGDWSDGPYRVQSALNRFKVESSSDAEIVSEWAGMCSDFDDGRCFRDATWDYSKVFALGDPMLIELWNKLAPQ